MSQTLCEEPEAGRVGPAGRRGDLVRRGVIILLVLYLSPAILLVLVLSGLGIGVCGVVGAIGRLAGRPGRVGPPRPHLALLGRVVRSVGR